VDAAVLEGAARRVFMNWNRFVRDYRALLPQGSIYYILILVTALTFVLEGGAQCVSSAHAGICAGGYRVTGIPTATFGISLIDCHLTVPLLKKLSR